MAENYDLIFGQSASQQYAWSDSDYQNGWQTVGSTPPTAEQFDALQRKSDTKAKDLNNRLSPLETTASKALARVTPAANRLPYFNSSNSATTTAISDFIKTLLDDGDAATARATLGAPSTTGANASGSWNINAATATKLATPRKIALTGNVTGSADFDGSKNIQIATSLANVSALAHSLLSKTTAADMRGVIEANAQNCGGIVAESLTSPGYVKFANGLLIEWGSVSVDHAPGADGIGTTYHNYWTYPIKMSVPLGAQATDISGNFPDPQPFCIWGLGSPTTLIVNCPTAGRIAFVLAIGIA